jgi:hypothetical protein
MDEEEQEELERKRINSAVELVAEMQLTAEQLKVCVCVCVCVGGGGLCIRSQCLLRQSHRRRDLLPTAGSRLAHPFLGKCYAPASICLQLAWTLCLLPGDKAQQNPSQSSQGAH